MLPKLALAQISVEQALAFLNEQRDSLLYVIGTTGSAPTLTFVQETRLIANIMSFALSQTADEAMVRKFLIQLFFANDICQISHPRLDSERSTMRS